MIFLTFGLTAIFNSHIILTEIILRFLCNIKGMVLREFCHRWKRTKERYSNENSKSNGSENTSGRNFTNRQWF
jgi:hypothetical protein